MVLASHDMQLHIHAIPVLTTFDAPPGYSIVRVIGPCWGITVRSRSVVGTACAGCQQIFGGEISALTELATESRNVAMQRLEQHAQAQGANAVLAMRFDSGELMQNTNEIVAYGTAVVIDQGQGASPAGPDASSSASAPSTSGQTFGQRSHAP